MVSPTPTRAHPAMLHLSMRGVGRRSVRWRWRGPSRAAVAGGTPSARAMSFGERPVDRSVRILAVRSSLSIAEILSVADAAFRTTRRVRGRRSKLVRGQPVRRAPAAAQSWDGVRDAVEYGSTALKPPYPSPIDRLLADRHRRRGVPEPERVDPDAVAVLVGSGRSRRRRTAPCDQQGP